MSWEVIIPFLRPIEALIRNPHISDILVNGSHGVFIEQDGELQEVPDVTISEKSLQVAVRNIARVLGNEVGEEYPLLDAKLPDGSRVAAVIPPCSASGTTLAIRKFHHGHFSAERLVQIGSLSAHGLVQLRDAVAGQLNILISGGTGTGKTTLLTALSAYFRAEERIIVIEDTSEIQLTLRNVVRLEARREQANLPPVTIRDLLRSALRLRPDRLLLGEVRGGEAFDLLQAMNTGHAGTISTIHANSAQHALSRFTTCVLQAGVELPYHAVRRHIADTLNVVVHIERRRGTRVVSEILRVQGYALQDDIIRLAPMPHGISATEVSHG